MMTERVAHGRDLKGWETEIQQDMVVVHVLVLVLVPLAGSHDRLSFNH